MFNNIYIILIVILSSVSTNLLYAEGAGQGRSQSGNLVINTKSIAFDGAGSLFIKIAITNSGDEIITTTLFEAGLMDESIIFIRLWDTTSSGKALLDQKIKHYGFSAPPDNRQTSRLQLYPNETYNVIKNIGDTYEVSANKCYEYQVIMYLQDILKPDRYVGVSTPDRICI